MILDYLFYNQRICHICKEEYTDKIICDDCLSKLEFIDGNFEFDEKIVYYPMFYNNFLKDTIKKYKFQGYTYLVKPLSLILLDYYKKKFANVNIDYVTYIPMDKKSEFKRSYNQVRLLAEEFSKLTGIEVIELIEKTRCTKEQNKLSIEQRKHNLKSSFRAIGNLDISGKTILLLDDLVTTGNTLRTASEVIERSYEVDLIFMTLTSSKLDLD